MEEGARSGGRRPRTHESFVLIGGIKGIRTSTHSARDGPGVALSETEEELNLSLRAGLWFEDFSRRLKDQFSNDWIWLGSAWALTQDAGLEPLEGAELVRNALCEDIGKRGIPKQLRAGLMRILREHSTPDPRPGAIFYDLVDVMLGRDVRRWMGDAPRGGAPVPIDSWSLRDAGYVDEWLLEIVRAKSSDLDELEGIEVDLLEKPTEDQYECAAEFFHECAKYLTESAYLGRSWKPHQAMSLGRFVLQHSLGVQSVWPGDIVDVLMGPET